MISSLHSSSCHSRARVWRAWGIPNLAPGRAKKTGTAAAAALNEVKGLGAAVVPSLRS
jgi:hypothetical protein